ncbi:MAG: hypothetical protein ABSC47_01665 [Terracidiphilus sp.]
MSNLTHMTVTACTALAAGLSLCATAQNPTAAISNGQVKATLYLPDSKNGYYRGTRFDWSGVVNSVQYAGHNYFGQWYDRMDPKVGDYVYEGTDIVTGPCTSIMGVPEEFTTNNTALGWDQAKAGGTFIKIGVGVLRRPDDRPYDNYRLYEIVDGGKWKVRKTSSSVEFTQELSDPATGYAYVYSKRVSLTRGKPQMVLEHSLRNTGKRVILTSVYDHNFTRMDNQGPNPDLTVKLQFQAQPDAPLDTKLVEFHENQIVFTKPLSGEERVMVPFRGFGTDSKDYDIRVENRKMGFGVRATGDRPLSRAALWGIRAVFSVEPFIDMTIEPGAEFTWKITYDYYTLPKDTQ